LSKEQYQDTDTSVRMTEGSRHFTTDAICIHITMLTGTARPTCEKYLPSECYYYYYLLLHDLYRANFENRVRGTGVARWRTWL